MTEKTVSIIIPVYNVEKYLKRCMDSVLGQSYRNIEVLLVDDGSSDSSPVMCDVYASSDPRVRVIHKQNGGLSDARNVGIDHSTGYYLCFIDSDDCIPLSAIEELVDSIVDYDADIACGELKYIKDNDGAWDFRHFSMDEADLSDDIYDSENALERMLYMYGITNSASAKLYRRTLFDSVRYPFGKHYEDLGTTYKIFSLANKVVFTHKPVYFYCQRIGSIARQHYSSKRLDALYFAREQLLFISSHHPRIVDAAKYRLFLECMNIIRDMPWKSKDSSMLKNELVGLRKSVMHDSKLSVKRKVFCLSSYFGIIGVKIAFHIQRILYRFKV